MHSVYNKTSLKFMLATPCVTSFCTVFFLYFFTTVFVFLNADCVKNIFQLDKFCFWFIIVAITTKSIETRKCQVPATEKFCNDVTKSCLRHLVWFIYVLRWITKYKWFYKMKEKSNELSSPIGPPSCLNLMRHLYYFEFVWKMWINKQ